MGWIGKIVGGTLGFAIGGPLGAIAGAAFGHAYDRTQEEIRQDETIRPLPGQEAQLTFFVATFSMLAKLASSDGEITKNEIDTVNLFMLYDLKLDPQSRMVATHIFNTALGSPNRFEDFAAQFYGQFHHQHQILEMMIDILLRVAVADGSLDPQEERLIRVAARMFDFSEASFQTLKAKYVQTSDRYYAVLGVNRDHPQEKIKQQYRKLVMEYHPDRIISKGLPEEFTQIAQDKFREIQEAYEAIKKERGMR
jgi:DnaJ like chaperone protein